MKQIKGKQKSGKSWRGSEGQGEVGVDMGRGGWRSRSRAERGRESERESGREGEVRSKRGGGGWLLDERWVNREGGRSGPGREGGRVREVGRQLSGASEVRQTSESLEIKSELQVCECDNRFELSYKVTCITETLTPARPLTTEKRNLP